MILSAGVQGGLSTSDILMFSVLGLHKPNGIAKTNSDLGHKILVD